MTCPAAFVRTLATNGVCPDDITGLEVSAIYIKINKRDDKMMIIKKNIYYQLLF